jgi:hypothetical protein
VSSFLTLQVAESDGSARPAFKDEGLGLNTRAGRKFRPSGKIDGFCRQRRSRRQCRAVNGQESQRVTWEACQVRRVRSSNSSRRLRDGLAIFAVSMVAQFRSRSKVPWGREPYSPRRVIRDDATGLHSLVVLCNGYPGAKASSRSTPPTRGARWCPGPPRWPAPARRWLRPARKHPCWAGLGPSRLHFR